MGFNGGFMVFYGGLMGFYGILWDLMGFNEIYPLVNTETQTENSSFLMGK